MNTELTKWQKRYKERKERGKCPWCGKPPEPGKVLCMECAEYKKDTRRFFLEIGFCPVCHKERIYGDEKECPECRARRIINNRLCFERAKADGRDWAVNATKYGTERAKARYARLKEQRLCVRCGKRNALYNRTMCQKCCDRIADKQRMYREKWETQFSFSGYGGGDDKG